jgi:hypothetical protein
MTDMNLTWVRTYEHNGDYIESIDGTDWADAPLPYPWHKCTPQTRGWFGLSYTERCACGATRLDGRYGHWMEKNQTRKARRKEQAEAKLPRVQVTCGECGQPYEAAAGTFIAREELCTDCWGKQFIAEYGGA